MPVEILFEKKEDCCGCGACVNACPVSAIELQEDEDGFKYPIVDDSKCIHCGRCHQVCSYQYGKRPASERKTYAAALNSDDIMRSSSGGIFFGIAEQFLAAQGFVYGCSMKCTEKGFLVEHVRVNDRQGLQQLQGSKYVQSSTECILKNIEADLKAGMQVLFSGTPCQVDGLKGYLGKDYSKLYTIDLVCHGVPNLRLFNDYIRFEEGRLNGKIEDFSFREKAEGWKLKGRISYTDSEGIQREKVFDPEDSSYYQMFLNSYTYRLNCYSCPYAGEHRPADLTIGDFWNIELTEPEFLKENGGLFDTEKGISCTVVNNAHGQELLELFGSTLTLAESIFEKAATYNRQMVAPSTLKPEREAVFQLYRQGYKEVDAWYQKRLNRIRRRRKLRNSIPKPVKTFVKKILRKQRQL